MQANCLVRTLKIRTDDQERLPRITFLIEDALRTASFPGIPLNGVVYVKCMDLGRFDSRTSSAFLSGRIDTFIRTLRPARVSSRSADQTELPAVWFGDELEPCRLLVEQLAAGHLPRAWFWPAAVEGWSARHPVAQNLQKIICHVLRKPAGLAHLAYVLEPLFKDDAILDLFQSLAEKPIRNLAASLGLLPKRALKNASLQTAGPALPDRPEEHADRFDNLNERHLELIAKAIQRWGSADARSVLITALAMADTDAAPSSEKIRRTMLQVAAQKKAWRHRPPETSAPAISPSARTIPLNFPPPAKETQPTHITEKADFLDAGKDRQTGLPDRGHDASRSETRRQKDSNASKGKSADADRMPPVVGSDAELSVAIGPGQALAPRGEGHAVPPAFRDRPDCRDDLPRGRQVRPEHPFAGAFTGFAGFPLLINVLERLGVESIFSDFPGYPVDDLRETILWRIALRQKIPRDDPATQFLRVPKLVFKRAKKAHIPVTRKAIFENARPDVQDLFRMPPSRNPLKPLGLKPVTDIFVIAVCRYIRSRSGMTIRKLIRRQAFVALTKSHMDITASMDTLDIHVRMAGLDVNPGWVPWLRRVIQIHYTEDDL